MELVANIDTWATEHLTLRTGHRRDAELGDIIDRIAATADRAFHLLMTDDLTGEHMHVAWTRLAELSIGAGASHSTPDAGELSRSTAFRIGKGPWLPIRSPRPLVDPGRHHSGSRRRPASTSRTKSS
ncbi:hypothetical protein ACW2Q0_22255 [Nocardia sp. R16R-3T]